MTWLIKYGGNVVVKQKQITISREKWSWETNPRQQATTIACVLMYAISVTCCSKLPSDYHATLKRIASEAWKDGSMSPDLVWSYTQLILLTGLPNKLTRPFPTFRTSTAHCWHARNCYQLQIDAKTIDCLQLPLARGARDDDLKQRKLHSLEKVHQHRKSRHEPMAQ